MEWGLLAAYLRFGALRGNSRPLAGLVKIAVRHARLNAGSPRSPIALIGRSSECIPPPKATAVIACRRDGRGWCHEARDSFSHSISSTTTTERTVNVLFFPISTLTSFPLSSLSRSSTHPSPSLTWCSFSLSHAFGRFVSALFIRMIAPIIAIVYSRVIAAVQCALPHRDLCTTPCAAGVRSGTQPKKCSREQLGKTTEVLAARNPPHIFHLLPRSPLREFGVGPVTKPFRELPPPFCGETNVQHMPTPGQRLLRRKIRDNTADVKRLRNGFPPRSRHRPANERATPPRGLRNNQPWNIGDQPMPLTQGNGLRVCFSSLTPDARRATKAIAINAIPPAAGFPSISLTHIA